MSDDQIILLALCEAIDDADEIDRDDLLTTFLSTCYPTWEAQAS